MKMMAEKEGHESHRMNDNTRLTEIDNAKAFRHLSYSNRRSYVACFINALVARSLHCSFVCSIFHSATLLCQARAAMDKQRPSFFSLNDKH